MTWSRSPAAGSSRCGRSAAGYLCAVGAYDPTNIRGAIWSYNHSRDYVDAVLARAGGYQQ